MNPCYKIPLLLVVIFSCTTCSLGFKILWFGSDDSEESQIPTFNGSPTVDYGECDWYDPTMSSNVQQQSIPATSFQSGFGSSSNVGGLGYDYPIESQPQGPGINYGLNGGFGQTRSVRTPSLPSSSYRSSKSHWSQPSSDFMSVMNGEPYDSNDLTAAHKTLPLGSYVLVINENNNHSVVVRIVENRGPNVVGRIMTLSQAAFNQIADLDERIIPCYVSLK